MTNFLVRLRLALAADTCVGESRPTLPGCQTAHGGLLLHRSRPGRASRLRRFIIAPPRQSIASVRFSFTVSSEWFSDLVVSLNTSRRSQPQQKIYCGAKASPLGNQPSIRLPPRWYCKHLCQECYWYVAQQSPTFLLFKPRHCKLLVMICATRRF